MQNWDRHEFTAAGGTRMHAAIMGSDDAPPVVCVHGLACSHRYFQPLGQQLASEFQVSAVDLPGFGWTHGPPRALDVRGMALALADWLRATDRDGAVLVGDSTGCQAIVDLAVIAPELMGPVVLCGPTFDRARRTYGRQVLALLANGPVDRTGIQMVPLRLADRYDSGLRRWWDTFRWCLPDPVEQKIDKIHTPAVVLRGGLDPIVPHRWAAELAGLLPHGELVTVPGTGHTVNFARPDAVAAACRRVATGKPRERRPHPVRARAMAARPLRITGAAKQHL